ncbi:MAG: hypothetical protein ISN26_00935 [Betaproteobacteria bacterium AqS2]|uniref:Uncharacterized protein n=1 Tax=Candidatus Amphirhobacter heronislandensis TaxID=1732024 RepID=A0A930UGX2_9GAMM|nr:hypothetical protein [Betaproteobacteria bacterium AqS2]
MGYMDWLYRPRKTSLARFKKLADEGGNEMNDTEPNALQQDTIDNIEDFEDLALSTYLKVRRLVGGDHPVTRRVSLAHTIMENAHSVQRAIPDPRVLDKSLMDDVEHCERRAIAAFEWLQAQSKKEESGK